MKHLTRAQAEEVLGIYASGVSSMESFEDVEQTNHEAYIEIKIQQDALRKEIIDLMVKGSKK